VNKLGALLKKRREELGLTQKNISDHCGWETAQMVSNYERGVGFPPGESFKKIIDMLKLDYNEVWDVFAEDLKHDFLEEMTEQ